MISKSLISPEFISPFSWLLILFLYKFLDHGLYALSDKVLIIILLWNFFLLFGIYLVRIYFISKIQEKSKLKQGFNKQISQLYYKITIYGFLPTIYIIYKQVQSISGDFFYSLRMANTGLVKTDISLGIFAYVITFAYVSFFIEFISWKKGDSKKRIFILFIINLIFAFITMSKTAVLFFIIPILITYMIKNKKFIPNLVFIRYAVITFFLMFGVQKIREQGSVLAQDNRTVFYTYLLGGLPALDQIVNSKMVSAQKGQNTFALFNNAAKKIGLAKDKPKTFENDITKEGYLKVPLYTNVYTVIGPIWLDYWFYSVTFFAMIVGALCGLFYTKSLYSEWAIIVYAYLFCVLFLQFFGEYIFTNLSLLIQLVVLSYLPFKFRNKRIIWKQ